MAKPKIDDSREECIDNEVVVDCYGEAERAMGWYYYLEDGLGFPFSAKCISSRSISPLKVGDKVEVIGMAVETECEHEMFVTVLWEKRKIGVPLSQLEGIGASRGTLEAVEDWRYWVRMGYEF